MKKHMLCILLVFTMLFCACGLDEQPTTVGVGVSPTTDKQTMTPTAPMQPTGSVQPTKPTQPTEPAQPTEPTQPLLSTPAEELAEFNTLFRDWKNWYNRALAFAYTDPTQIQLRLLFYLGFDGESREPTDAEWAELKEQPGFDINYGLMRLPVDRMNQVLTDLFGITLEDVDDAGFENLVYLESTRCYYHMVTDALIVEDFNAIAVESIEDGSIRVYYTAYLEDTVYVVTLMAHGDGYRILSNVCVE